jgi:hypothetical protein
MLAMSDDQKNPSSRNIVLQAAAGSFGVIGMSATIRVRDGFTISHLQMAARFSRYVGEIERDNASQPFGPFYDEMKGFATACVMSAVAGVEAYINEVFFERDKNFSATPSAALDLVWENIATRPDIIRKFDDARKLLGLPKTDRKTYPGDDMETLILLRNRLTHFHPEWRDEQRRHAELSKRLEPCCKGNPYFPNEAWFPSRWIAHDATTWAVMTALEFIRAFEADTKITKWDWTNVKLAP